MGQIIWLLSYLNAGLIGQPSVYQKPTLSWDGACLIDSSYR